MNEKTDEAESVSVIREITGKKNYKSYLWEFVMLFFAVFCGFLAENQREDIADRKLEKIYISSLLEDLVKDTAELTRVSNNWEIVIQKTDTLRDDLSHPLFNRK